MIVYEPAAVREVVPLTCEEVAPVNEVWEMVHGEQPVPVIVTSTVEGSNPVPVRIKLNCCPATGGFGVVETVVS